MKQTLGGGHEQGAGHRGEDEKEGTEGEVLCSTDPGAYAQTEKKAQVPGQGGRGGTWGFESQMNSPCLPVETLREPDTGGRMAALIRRYLTEDRQARGQPDGANILGLSSLEEAALGVPRHASSLHGAVLPLRVAAC